MEGMLTSALSAARRRTYAKRETPSFSAVVKIIRSCSKQPRFEGDKRNTQTKEGMERQRGGNLVRVHARKTFMNFALVDLIATVD